MVSSKEYKIPQIRLAYVSDHAAEYKKAAGSKETADFIRSTYQEGEIEYRESFRVVYLNRANRILGFQTISEGGTSATIVDNKMIFAGALLFNAHSIIMCHNHPSGNLIPSPEDDIITRKAKSAGEILNIRVLDHLIISADGYYSYNDEGRL